MKRTAELGTYSNPEKTGYLGWIKTKSSITFIDLLGNLHKWNKRRKRYFFNPSWRY